MTMELIPLKDSTLYTIEKYPLSPTRAPVEMIALLSRRQQRVLVLAVSDQIFGYHSDQHQRLLMIVQRGYWLLTLDVVYEKLEKFIAAHDVDSIRLLLLANAIPIRRKSFPRTSEIDSLLDDIFRHEQLPSLKFASNSERRKFTFQLLVSCYQKDYAHQHSRRTLRKHSLHTHELERKSMKISEGAMHTEFFQNMFEHLRQTQGIAVGWRTYSQEETSDVFNQGLNTIGGIGRELTEAYFPLQVQDKEYAKYVIHKQIASLDIFDSIRVLYHLLLLQSIHQTGYNTRVRMGTKLFYRAMHVLQRIYTGNSGGSYSSKNLLQEVKSLTSELSNSGRNLDGIRFVTQKDQDSLQYRLYETGEELEARAEGTRVHHKLLRYFPTLFDVTNPWTALKHQQMDDLITVAEVPIRVQQLMGRIDLLVFARQTLPNENGTFSVRHLPVILLDVKTVDCKAGEWQEAVSRYPRSADVAQLHAYQQLLQDRLLLTEEQVQNIRLGIFVVQRSYLGVKRASKRAKKLVAGIHALIPQVLAEEGHLDRRSYELHHANRPLPAQLVLLPGTIRKVEVLPGRPHQIRSLEDQEVEDTPFTRAIDVYSMYTSLDSNAVACSLQIAMTVLCEWMEQNHCLVVLPTLVIEQRLQRQYTRNNRFVTELSEQALEGWLKTPSHKPKALLFWEYDLLEHTDQVEELLVQVANYPWHTYFTLVRFRRQRLGLTYSVHYNRRTITHAVDHSLAHPDLPYKRLIYVPPPFTFGTKMDLSPNRYRLEETRGSSPQLTVHQFSRIHFDGFEGLKRTDFDPVAMLDVLVDYSEEVFEPKYSVSVEECPAESKLGESSVRETEASAGDEVISLNALDSDTMQPTTDSSIASEQRKQTHKVRGELEIRERSSSFPQNHVLEVPECIRLRKVYTKELRRFGYSCQRSDVSKHLPEACSHSSEDFQSFLEARSKALEDLLAEVRSETRLEGSEDIPPVTQWLGMNYYHNFPNRSAEWYEVLFQHARCDLLQQLGYSFRIRYVRNLEVLEALVEEALTSQIVPEFGSEQVEAHVFIRLPVHGLDDRYSYWMCTVFDPMIYRVRADWNGERASFSRVSNQELYQIATQISVSQLGFISTVQLHANLVHVRTKQFEVEVSRGHTSRYLRVRPARKREFPKANISEAVAEEVVNAFKRWQKLSIAQIFVTCSWERKRFVLTFHEAADDYGKVEVHDRISLPTSKQAVEMLRKQERSLDGYVIRWKRKEVIYDDICRQLQPFVKMNLQEYLHLENIPFDPEYIVPQVFSIKPYKLEWRFEGDDEAFLYMKYRLTHPAHQYAIFNEFFIIEGTAYRNGLDEVLERTLEVMTVRYESLEQILSSAIDELEMWDEDPVEIPAEQVDRLHQLFLDLLKEQLLLCEKEVIIQSIEQLTTTDVRFLVDTSSYGMNKVSDAFIAGIKRNIATWKELLGENWVLEFRGRIWKDANGVTRDIAYTWDMLAQVYMQRKEYNRSLEMISLAENMRKQLGLEENLWASDLIRSEYYYWVGDGGKLREVCVKIIKEKETLMGVSYALNQLSIQQNREEKVEESIRYICCAINWSKRIKNRNIRKNDLETYSSWLENLNHRIDHEVHRDHIPQIQRLTTRYLRKAGKVT